MNVLFLSAALDEHLARVDFYNRCRAGLGAEYLAEVSAAVARILEAPSSFPAMNPAVYRRCVMRRVPFTIIF